MDKIMNCAIYIRVSTQEQADEGYSISAQKQRLMAYAQSQDWNVVNLYADEGQSAKDTKRDDLQRMLSDIRKGLIDVVLVYKLDRLTRSVLDLYELLQIFEKHDCKFKSATEVYDTTTAMGRLFLTLVAALAQWERENLGERVRMGMREKARQGKWIGSTPPLGYDLIDGELVINDIEASVVRKIYDMYLNGLGVKKICYELEKQKIRTKRTKSYLWQEGSVISVLKNPIYIGKIRWGVRKNKDDYFTANDESLRIMDDEIFNRAQEVRKARSTYKGRQATSDYIFSGILRCSQCGGNMTGKLSNTGRGGNVNHSYICRNRFFRRCNMPSISERMLEKKFIEYFQNMSLSKQINKVAKETSKHTDDDQKKINRLKKQLEGIKNRRKKWQYAWANELIKDDEFTGLIQDEREKEESVIDQLNELDGTRTRSLTNASAINELSKYIDHWSELDNNEKKQLLQILIKEIVVQHHNSKHFKDRVEIKRIVFN